MPILQSLLISLGLSMDAFAVSITNGLTLKQITKKTALSVAFAFGFFQAIMPLIGYAIGSTFASVIQKFDHYIALIFLSFIGGKMLWDGIRELRHSEKEAIEEKNLSFGSLLIQAIATSIDALIIGISFVAMAMTWSEVVITVLMIGGVTFTLSFIGVYMGKKFGEMLGSKAEIIGGIILVAIGLKIFIEHTFFGG